MGDPPGGRSITPMPRRPSTCAQPSQPRLFHRQVTWAFNNSRSTRHYYDARGITWLDDCALSDGNADGISGLSKETVVKDGPHAGETTGRGGSKEGLGDGMGEWIDDVDKSLSLSWRSSAGKHRPPRPAGKGTGDESSVSSLSEQPNLLRLHVI